MLCPSAVCAKPVALPSTILPAAVMPQVLIGEGTGPRAGAMLDLNSTTQGLVLPNISLNADLTQFLLPDTDVATAEGMMVYNTNPNAGFGKGVYVWMGTTWKQVNPRINVTGISAISPETVELTAENATQQLSATVIPSHAADTAIEWALEAGSDAGIASVDASGLVTAHKAGQVTVTATAHDNAAATTSRVVTVNIPATQVNITPAGPVNLTFDGTQQLTATVTPAIANQAVTWSSGSSTIATVNTTGEVSAVSGAGGQTTITATSVATPSIQKSVTINVAPAQPSAIQGLVASLVAGETMTLSVTPVGAATYEWTFPTDNFTGTSTSNSITLTAKTISINLANTFSVKAVAPTCGLKSTAREGTQLVAVTSGAPGPITFSARTVNSGGTFTLTTTAPTPAGSGYYKWIVPSDFKITGVSTGASITVQANSLLTDADKKYAASEFKVAAGSNGGPGPQTVGTGADVEATQTFAFKLTPSGQTNVAVNGTTTYAITDIVPVGTPVSSITWNVGTPSVAGLQSQDDAAKTATFTGLAPGATTISATMDGVTSFGTYALAVGLAAPASLTFSTVTDACGTNLKIETTPVTGATGYEWTFDTSIFGGTSPMVTPSPILLLASKSGGTIQGSSFTVAGVNLSPNVKGPATQGTGTVTVPVNVQGLVEYGSYCWDVNPYYDPDPSVGKDINGTKYYLSYENWAGDLCGKRGMKIPSTNVFRTYKDGFLFRLPWTRIDLLDPYDKFLDYNQGILIKRVWTTRYNDNGTFLKPYADGYDDYKYNSGFDRGYGATDLSYRGYRHIVTCVKDIP